MSRISHNIEPLCYTSDGVYLYAIARGYILKNRYSKPDFFVVRSNPYPASLTDLSWEVIESSPVSPDTDIQRIVYPHTALCAWNPSSSSFVMLVNGLRYGSHIDRLGVSLSSRLLPLTFSSDEPHIGDSTAQGRSLLLPISNQAAHQGNTSDILYYSSSWVQIDLESSTKEMLFTFYPEMDIFREPQVRWSMDKFGTDEPPSTVYSLLTASNNSIYALGSSDNGLVMSMFPENISFVAPYATQPISSAITTVHTPGVGLDCALESERTRITADKGTIYLTCYPSRKSGADMSTYKVYKFDGSKFQQLPSIPSEIISTYTSSNTPFLIPVPNKDPTSPAIWGLVSLGDGKLQFYNLTGQTTNTPWQPKIFQTNRPYTFYPTTIEDPEHAHATKSPTFGMLLAVAAFGLLMSAYGMFVYHQNRRTEALRALEGGVNRVTHGDDACDSLPRYTPRAHIADQSDFLEGMFHGRMTRPPSYKTILSMNSSRSATRSIMLASASSTSLTEPAAEELELHDVPTVTTVDEAVTPDMSGIVAAAPISPPAELRPTPTTNSASTTLAAAPTADVMTSGAVAAVSAAIQTADSIIPTSTKSTEPSTTSTTNTFIHGGS
ncbi:hypothetical protein BG015_009256 [Linnemannia schmuckeri]|uniref:Uncharacterized protein n=1 Tax=Linnemannia schmuckeri TaxID=64567 RepID=A0A9P5S5E6_9FUNG|nr:hypothetical protein BG015_009256 [Linnemannia schmuckeri]